MLRASRHPYPIGTPERAAGQVRRRLAPRGGRRLRHAAVSFANRRVGRGGGFAVAATTRAADGHKPRGSGLRRPAVVGRCELGRHLPRPVQRPTRAPLRRVAEGQRAGAREEEGATGGSVQIRRMGVSEGRMRYAEVSRKKPFVLSSFVLEDDGSCWTLEHQVALNRLGGWNDGIFPFEEEEGKLCIGVIDPLNASIMILTVGNYAISIDMDRGKAIGGLLIQGAAGPVPSSSGFLIPCALPLWLGSSLIPSAGNLLFHVFLELHV